MLFSLKRKCEVGSKNPILYYFITFSAQVNNYFMEGVCLFLKVCFMINGLKVRKLFSSFIYFKWTSVGKQRIT